MNTEKKIGNEVSARLARIGAAGFSGGGGRAMKAAAEEAMKPALMAAAERAGRRRRLEAIRKKRAAGARGAAAEPKLSGPGFNIIMIVAVFKDILDPIAAIIQLIFFTSGTAVAVGGAVGAKYGELAGVIVGGIVKALDFIPGVVDVFDLTLSMLVWFLALFVALALSFAIWMYLFFSGVPMTHRRLAVIIVSLIMGMIPFINFFPETMAMLYILRRMEKKKWEEKMSKRTKGIVKKAWNIMYATGA